MDEQNKGRQAVFSWLFHEYVERLQQSRSLICCVKIPEMICFMALHSEITMLSFNAFVVQVAGFGEAISSCSLLYKIGNNVVNHQA